MSGPLGSAQWMYATGAEAPQQSLKFNDDESQYLSWTPAAAGNRKTWTWSGWVKRGESGDGTGSNHFFLFNASTDNIDFYQNSIRFYFASGTSILTTNQVFRDYSAWYHLVFAVDTTQATASDRMKIYVNGEQITSFSSSTYPALNYEGSWNSAVAHNIAKNNATNYFHGYLSDIHFIDGQALDPTSFGQFTDGYWEAKDYAGTYGTNGFHLTFADDVVSEGFNTVTYVGNGGTQSISGLGFAPDFVWLKDRANATQNHELYDTVRGAGKRLSTSLTNAEDGDYSITSFDADGFTVTDNTGQVNASICRTVGWCWDAGSGSAASNTDGSITSTVKANLSYGFSVATYTGTGSAATVGHGLSSALDMVITKRRDSTGNWNTWHTGIPATNKLTLNTTDASGSDTGAWNSTAPTSTVFSIANAGNTNVSGATYVAYCFHSVAGYSSFGSYTGTGAAGNAVNCGFRPAFLMIKRTDTTGNWEMFDDMRNISNDPVLYANQAAVESAAAGRFTFTSTGFTLDDSGAGRNASGGTYIYMAFADTREAAFWKDVSGQGNHWTPNNLDYRDSLIDSPANNFAVMNAIATTHNLSEGNLRVDCDNGTAAIPSTILAASGKWYSEISINDLAGSNTYVRIGVVTADGVGKDLGGVTGTFAFLGDGRTYSEGSVATYGTAVSTGDIFQVALDNDNGKLWFGINGTWMASGDPASGSNPSLTFTAGEQMGFAVASGSGGFSPDFTANFGQDSTFAGARAAGGNTDDNGIGDFAYAPPSGFLALCTQNLPTPTIVDGSQHFNTVLYTGTGASNSIANVGHAPDFVWIKRRDTTGNNDLFDSVRGVQKVLKSNATNAEVTLSTLLTSFDSDGFTIGTNSDLNASGGTYAAWNWKAGGTAVSNTDGSITSQVSANVDAGFSVVSFTASTGGTVGHALNQTPEVVIFKDRDAVGNWYFFTTAVDSSWDYLLLNGTYAKTDYGTTFANSTTFESPAGSNNNIAYCFHSVDGFSKVGSYTGNGSTDGPFVYTGFRPAWVMVKQSSASGNSWEIRDSLREPYNDSDRNILRADTSDAEATGAYPMDFLSNGFKPRYGGSSMNGSGSTYIYLAFAEHPFKYANAR